MKTVLGADIMKVTPKKLIDFAVDLSSLVLDDYKNTQFRYHTLLLIQKYFKVEKLSFVLFKEDVLDNDTKYKEALMDNVTLGISKESIEDYYRYYYKVDPLYNAINIDNQEIKTQDLPQGSDFEDTEFYKEFYDKYGQYHQVSVGLEYENKILGVLTFIKSHEKGDFSERDLDGIEKIRLLVANELIKSLRYENLHLENHALKESTKDFPVAQLILDHDYNVSYYNDEAVAYVDALIGSKPMGFKYFFINELVIPNLIDEDQTENSVDLNGFTIMVSRKVRSYNLDRPREIPYYNVYLFKKDLDNQVSFKTNKYYELLTEREKEIALLIRKGLSNDEIAKKLVISPLTVKTHIQRIYSKCNVSNRIQLIYLLFEE